MEELPDKMFDFGFLFFCFVFMLLVTVAEGCVWFLFWPLAFSNKILPLSKKKKKSIVFLLCHSIKNLLPFLLTNVFVGFIFDLMHHMELC